MNGEENQIRSSSPLPELTSQNPLQHLFVAPIMKTFFLLDMPSISVSIWLMTLSDAPPASPPLPPLDLAMESSSSKNKMQGAACLACRQRRGQEVSAVTGGNITVHFVLIVFPCSALTFSNTSLTLASDSPNHMVSISGPLMETKFAWHSLAMAFARSVFPQPGGP